MLTGQAGLRVVQPQAERGQLRIVMAARGGQRCAQPLQGGGIARAVVREQFLGLLLELAEIGAGGNALQETPPCINGR